MLSLLESALSTYSILPFIARSWLSVRIEFIGSCLVLLAGLFAVIAKDKITSGLVRLSLRFAVKVSEFCPFVFRLPTSFVEFIPLHACL